MATDDKNDNLKDLSGEYDESLTSEYYTLTDEDGKESEFELIGEVQMKGNKYYALIPTDTDPDAEFVDYVILKSVIDEDGEEALVTIEDDDEYDDVADYFEDDMIDEIDYDAIPTQEKAKDTKAAPDKKKDTKPVTNNQNKGSKPATNNQNKGSKPATNGNNKGAKPNNNKGNHKK